MLLATDVVSLTLLRPRLRTLHTTLMHTRSATIVRGPFTELSPAPGGPASGRFAATLAGTALSALTLRGLLRRRAPLELAQPARSTAASLAAAADLVAAAAVLATVARVAAVLAASASAAAAGAQVATTRVVLLIFSTASPARAGATASLAGKGRCSPPATRTAATAAASGPLLRCGMGELNQASLCGEVGHELLEVLERDHQLRLVLRHPHWGGRFHTC